MKLRLASRRVLITALSAALAVPLVVAVPFALARQAEAPTGGLDSVQPSTSPEPPRIPAQRDRPILATTLRPSTAGPWRILPYEVNEWDQIARLLPCGDRLDDVASAGAPGRG